VGPTPRRRKQPNGGRVGCQVLCSATAISRGFAGCGLGDSRSRLITPRRNCSPLAVMCLRRGPEALGRITGARARMVGRRCCARIVRRTPTHWARRSRVDQRRGRGSTWSRAGRRRGRAARVDLSGGEAPAPSCNGGRKTRRPGQQRNALHNRSNGPRLGVVNGFFGSFELRLRDRRNSAKFFPFSMAASHFNRHP